MAHQRAAADAARLQRQLPAEAHAAPAGMPPRSPRPVAATPRRVQCAASEHLLQRAPAAAAADDAADSMSVSPAAGEMPSPDTKAVLRGGSREVSPEALDYLQAAPSDDEAHTGVCNKLQASINLFRHHSHSIHPS